MMAVSAQLTARSPAPHLILKSPADFYNYFQHGIDILLSGTTHTVKKIILHSNIVRLLFIASFES